MGDALHLYWRYLMISMRAQLQYRAAFLLAALGQFLVTGTEFLGIWVLFERFGHLATWRFVEVALFYGVVNSTFACADALSTGFDLFGSNYVKTGDFDRLLLRPRSTVLQLAGHELALRRIGRLAQGLLVFGWAAAALDIHWWLGNISLLLFTVISGICFFFGLIMIQATLAFWTTETLEIMNILTYGGAVAGTAQTVDGGQIPKCPRPAHGLVEDFQPQSFDLFAPDDLRWVVRPRPVGRDSGVSRF